MREEIPNTCTKNFWNDSWSAARYSFTKPTPKCKYIQALQLLNFCPDGYLTMAELWTMMGYKNDGYWHSGSILRALRAAGHVRLFRNGKRYEYQISESGRQLLKQAYQG